MVYFPLIFLCIAGIFITLLQDRYRIWTTLIGMAGTYILAIAAAALAGSFFTGPTSSLQVPCAAGTFLFFLASLFLHVNNPLQKLFLALLSMANFAYFLLFTPLLLGVLPFDVSGGAGAVLALVSALFLNALMILFLYRPFQRYSGRGVSLFLGGMCLLLVFQYLLCLGWLDIFLGLRTPVARLLLATTVYTLLVFCFRSLYQAGRYQAETAKQAARARMLEMESGDFGDMLSAVREVRAAQKNGEYALDTVVQLMREGQTERIPVYVAMVKRNAILSPILGSYHENPYLNGVIATKAAFAAQNNIDFQSNATTGDVPFKTSELCIMVNELLTRACSDAARFEGERRLRFTAIPGEDALRLETVYTGELPEKEKFSFKGKQFTDLLAWLFDDSSQQEDELRGLENTAEIVLAHSGSLTVSGAPGEIVIRAMLRY